MYIKIIIGFVAIIILAIGTVSKADNVADTSKVAVLDVHEKAVSHAKPLPAGCATVECKGIKGHVSAGDALLHSYDNKKSKNGMSGGTLKPEEVGK